MYCQRPAKVLCCSRASSPALHSCRGAEVSAICTSREMEHEQTRQECACAFLPRVMALWLVNGFFSGCRDRHGKAISEKYGTMQVWADQCTY